jgi:CHASE2 domain-containing sensor protein
MDWKGRFDTRPITDRWTHWFVVIWLISIGLVIGAWLETAEITLHLQYRVYQFLNRRARSASHSDDVVLVLIGDDEYWKGSELARRVPLNRRYLAKLVSKIQQADPKVIALDFDMRPPTDDGSIVEHRDYVEETAMLAKSIDDATCHCKIVVPRAIRREKRGWSEIRDIFDARRSATLARGYILVPNDVRQIALALPNSDGKHRIDSFASAVVSAAAPAAVADARPLEESWLPFGRYHRNDFFDHMSASDLLTSDAPLDRLSHKIVIIGGAWSRYAFHEGDMIDAHDTPVGVVPGAYIHANYVQALLAHETTRSLPEWVAKAIDVLLSFTAAFLLATRERARKAITLISLNTGAIVVCLLLWQVFGLYFDFVIPLLLLSAHVAVEQIFDWRKGFIELRRLSAQQEATT